MRTPHLRVLDIIHSTHALTDVSNQYYVPLTAQTRDLYTHHYDRRTDGCVRRSLALNTSRPTYF